MSVSTKILYGDTLDKILPPQKKTNYIVKLPGTYKGKPTSFEIDTDTLSKHSLFIGGTGVVRLHYDRLSSQVQHNQRKKF